jgi:hypothetical protein
MIILKLRFLLVSWFGSILDFSYLQMIVFPTLSCIMIDLYTHLANTSFSMLFGLFNVILGIMQMMLVENHIIIQH